MARDEESEHYQADIGYPPSEYRALCVLLSRTRAKSIR
jgi:hypothetical protein